MIDNIFRLKKSYTFVLIIINVVVFFLAWILIGSLGEEFFLNYFALTPVNFFSGEVWTVFTSMFSHILPFHIFANMISLFFLGLFTEKLIGKKRFLGLYLVSGIFAGVFFAFLAYFFGGSDIGGRLFGTPGTAALGASGAIFGLLGLLAILTPKNKVYLIAGPLVALVLFPFVSIIEGFFGLGSGFSNVASLLINIYIFFSIFAILSFNPELRKYALPLEMPFWILPFIAIIPLVVIGLFVPLPIGNSAHLGGLLIGLGYGIYLKKKYPRKTKMISRTFS